jgi:hypothetical protein
MKKKTLLYIASARKVNNYGANGNRIWQVGRPCTYKDDNCLTEAFFEVLKPTFVTIADSKLLERCIRGATQNPNQSLNSMVWIRCPKHKYHGFKVVRCAVASAVCHFHQGAKSRIRIMEDYLPLLASFTNRAFELKDKKRLNKADKQASKK